MIKDLHRPNVEIGYCYHRAGSSYKKAMTRLTIAYLPDHGLTLHKVNAAYALTRGHTNRVTLLNKLLPGVDPFSFNPDELYIDETTNQLYTLRR